jgi:hypothetical protein
MSWSHGLILIAHSEMFLGWERIRHRSNSMTLVRTMFILPHPSIRFLFLCLVPSLTQDSIATGAFLNLTGPIFHTVEVYINDQKADQVNLWDPVVDISSHLSSGTNNVTIITASTLINVVSSIASEVWSAGDSGAGYANAAKQHYGLVGDAIINFYNVP